MVLEVFPTCIGDTIAEYITKLNADFIVVRRPLRETDANGAISIQEQNWVPESYDIGPTVDPATALYPIIIQTLIKHQDEQLGRALSSRLAKRLRAMLYRNDALRVALFALQETLDGTTEKVARIRVMGQSFMANDFGTPIFSYLTVTELAVYTETH